MKLKKIVSLALAGVMAVSMLAGCANNGGNGGNDSGKEPVTQPATGVAAAFNDAQSSTNKAKVVFSNDNSLDAALSQAIKINGQDADESSIYSEIRYITGLVDDGAYVSDDDDSADGLTITNLYVMKLSTDADYTYNVTNPTGVGSVKIGTVWTDEAAIEGASRVIDAIAAKLDDTTYEKDKTEADATYYDYSYTGNASMVSVKTVDGGTNFYFAWTITQTCKAEVL